MRSRGRGKLATRVTLVSGALALAGCVPGAYLYDDIPGTYYGGGGAYHAPPAYYYGSPGYQGYTPYPPRVVYVDHDHRGDDCRHQAHRSGDDRGDRDDKRHDRRPPRDPQEGPPAAPPENRDSRRQRAPRVQDGDEPVKQSEARKDLD